MQKGNMTREEAIAIVGLESVEKAERENCEPTNRVGYNGAEQGDGLCEWSASVRCQDKDGDACTLLAYYYTTNEQDQAMAAANGDGSAIDWEIAGYKIV